jgi:hypothetical protein
MRKGPHDHNPKAQPTPSLERGNLGTGFARRVGRLGTQRIALEPRRRRTRTVDLGTGDDQNHRVGPIGVPGGDYRVDQAGSARRVDYPRLTRILSRLTPRSHGGKMDDCVTGWG